MMVQSALLFEAQVIKDKKFAKEQQRIINYLNTIIEKSRQMAMRLRPSTLEVLGLISALEMMFKDMGANNKLKISFQHHKLDNLQFNADPINLFRIVQEALTNIIKHAKASLIKIKMTKTKGMLKVSIQDNGRGFVSNGAESGLGLKTMHERAKLLGGTITIDSKLKCGTEIIINVPMSEGKQL